LPTSTSAALLGGIARFFRQRGEGRMNPRPADLLPQIDEALNAVLGAPASAAPAASRSAVTALVGLRRNLFPDAPPMLAGAPVQGASA
jgi:hypothetical protein